MNLIKRKFCEKVKNDFAKFAFKNKGKQPEEILNKENTDNVSESSNSRRSIYLKNKLDELVNVYKPDLIYFKYDEDFTTSDLRKKYLDFAKMYHPDIKNDLNSNIKFSKLKESYERLKRFAEIRDDLIKMETEGTITIDLNDFEKMNIPRNNTLDEKEEYIKQLIIGEYYGDIKEPRWMMQFMLFVCISIGVVVFYIDIRKYYLYLKKRREGVFYNI
jgi:hypothetical protein